MLTFDVLQVSDIFCKNWKINILLNLRLYLYRIFEFYLKISTSQICNILP